MLIKFIVTIIVLTALSQIIYGQSDEKKKTEEKPLILMAVSPAKEKENPEAVKHRNNGIIFGVNLENDKAIAEFNKAIEIDPNFADAYSRRGAAYSNKSDYDRAIKDFNKAIELDPKHEVALLNRASVYMLKENYKSAIADFSRLIVLFPKSVLYYSLRADVYDKNGSKKLAAADRQTVKKLRAAEKQ